MLSVSAPSLGIRYTHEIDDFMRERLRRKSSASPQLSFLACSLSLSPLKLPRPCTKIPIEKMSKKALSRGTLYNIHWHTHTWFFSVMYCVHVTYCSHERCTTCRCSIPDLTLSGACVLCAAAAYMGMREGVHVRSACFP